MTLLEYAKAYHNFDIYLVLMDDAGYTDVEIMDKFSVSKQGIYNARKRLEPIIASLSGLASPKRDLRNKDVQTIVEAFMTAFGTTKTTLHDRYAAKRLHGKYGAQNVATIIQALASHPGKFAPTVNSVYELENKWVSVGKYLQSESNTGVMEL